MSTFGTPGFPFGGDVRPNGSDHGENARLADMSVSLILVSIPVRTAPHAPQPASKFGFLTDPIRRRLLRRSIMRVLPLRHDTLKIQLTSLLKEEQLVTTPVDVIHIENT